MNQTLVIDASGLKTFSLNGSQLIRKPGLSLIKINGAPIGALPYPVLLGSNTVQHGYPNMAIKYAYSLVSGVMQILITIQNATDGPLCNPKFQLPTLNIVGPITTNDKWWGETYVRDNNEGAPDFQHPTHAFYSFCPTLGSSIHVKSHFRSQTLVDSNQLYVNCTIPPRGSVTINVVWNITADTSLPGLFGPYRSDYINEIGLTAIPADSRVCFQAYVSTNPKMVNPANPYGYQELRLDTPDGINAAIAMLKPAIGKTQGMFIVDPQGVQSRGQQIRSEWLDTLPPETLANLPTLFAWGKTNGVSIGIGVRPSAVIVPENFSTDQIWILSPDQFPYVGQRIKNALAMGMSGPIYWDTLGYSLADANLISYMRGILGPTIKTYTEAWTALSINDSGTYAPGPVGPQWNSAYSLTDCQLARFLQPSMNIISEVMQVDPAAHIEACKAQNIAPLFDVDEVSTVIPLLP